MTIASEITRLQGAKADIRQAIIDKGVDVCADLTIDDYACCIADIPTGGGTPYTIKYLLVGGGGSGAGNGAGGGGGGGEVVPGKLYTFQSLEFNIVIGSGGASAYNAPGNAGGDSCIVGEIDTIISKGGCGGTQQGGQSGSGCTGGNCVTCNGYWMGGGGGGAGGNGSNASAQCKGGDGGNGLFGYGGGGGGYTGYSNANCGGKGKDGGGDGHVYGYGKFCNASGCGGGGGGGGFRCGYYCTSGCGGGGLAKICYPTDGSYGYTTATGGNCCTSVTEGGVTYCVHCFTSNGTFCITG